MSEGEEGQEEDLSEAERYADRILRIAQEESAEHQVLSDPFDRSVALVLSLVKEEGMDPWNIERIEVLKGPQSTLWGTDAMGGVVNIVTKRPENGFSRRAFAQTGSFNTFPKLGLFTPC